MTHSPESPAAHGGTQEGQDQVILHPPHTRLKSLQNKDTIRVLGEPHREGHMKAPEGLAPPQLIELKNEGLMRAAALQYLRNTYASSTK